MVKLDERESTAFLRWLEQWENSLENLPLADVIEASGAERVGIFCIDVLNGFCKEGPLSSPRVGAIVQPIVHLLTGAYGAGVRQFILPQDSHPADSPEFGAWPPHCVEGTKEAETVSEIADLPFAAWFHIIPKRSINPSLRTTLDEEMDSRLIDVAICTGDCTDLCLYQLAMHLRLRANARGVKKRVIVPADCTNTYDLTVDEAAKAGALPHPGDLLHTVFLYHMALNGIEVVKSMPA